jgi:hypothetical protein
MICEALCAMAEDDSSSVISRITKLVASLLTAEA